MNPRTPSVRRNVGTSIVQEVFGFVTISKNFFPACPSGVEIAMLISIIPTRAHSRFQTLAGKAVLYYQKCEQIVPVGPKLRVSPDS